MEFRQRMKILNENKKKLESILPTINDNAGIYFLTRFDENGFKYAYVGQSKHLLTRLAEHLLGREQHIDRSLQKHKLFSDNNPYGWRIDFINCSEDILDECEIKTIKRFADEGYQLRNKTLGGQGQGKDSINDFKEQKGYRKGVKYGELKAKKAVKAVFDKYLDFSIKPPVNKIKQRKFEEFKNYLGGTEDDTKWKDFKTFKKVW